MITVQQTRVVQTVKSTELVPPEETAKMARTLPTGPSLTPHLIGGDGRKEGRCGWWCVPPGHGGPRYVQTCRCRAGAVQVTVPCRRRYINVGLLQDTTTITVTESCRVLVCTNVGRRLVSLGTLMIYGPWTEDYHRRLCGSTNQTWSSAETQYRRSIVYVEGFQPFGVDVDTAWDTPGISNTAPKHWTTLPSTN